MLDPLLVDLLAKQRLKELQHEAEEFRRARAIKESRKPHRRHRWWRR